MQGGPPWSAPPENRALGAPGGWGVDPAAVRAEAAVYSTPRAAYHCGRGGRRWDSSGPCRALGAPSAVPIESVRAAVGRLRCPRWGSPGHLEAPARSERRSRPGPCRVAHLPVRWRRCVSECGSPGVSAPPTLGQPRPRRDAGSARRDLGDGETGPRDRGTPPGLQGATLTGRDPSWASPSRPRETARVRGHRSGGDAGECRAAGRPWLGPAATGAERRTRGRIDSAG